MTYILALNCFFWFFWNGQNESLNHFVTLLFEEKREIKEWFLNRCKA